MRYDTIREWALFISRCVLLIFRAYTVFVHVCIWHGLSLQFFLLSFTCSFPFPIRWVNINRTLYRNERIHRYKHPHCVFVFTALMCVRVRLYVYVCIRIRDIYRAFSCCCSTIRAVFRCVCVANTVLALSVFRDDFFCFDLSLFFFMKFLYYYILRFPRYITVCIHFFFSFAYTNCGCSYSSI